MSRGGKHEVTGELGIKEGMDACRADRGRRRRPGRGDRPRRERRRVPVTNGVRRDPPVRRIADRARLGAPGRRVRPRRARPATARRWAARCTTNISATSIPRKGPRPPTPHRSAARASARERLSGVEPVPATRGHLARGGRRARAGRGVGGRNPHRQGRGDQRRAPGARDPGHHARGLLDSLRNSTAGREYLRGSGRAAVGRQPLARNTREHYWHLLTATPGTGITRCSPTWPTHSSKSATGSQRGQGIARSRPGSAAAVPGHGPPAPPARASRPQPGPATAATGRHGAVTLLQIQHRRAARGDPPRRLAAGRAVRRRRRGHRRRTPRSRAGHRIHERAKSGRGPDGPWLRNADRTIRRKGFDKPNIVTGEMVSERHIAGEVTCSTGEMRILYGNGETDDDGVSDRDRAYYAETGQAGRRSCGPSSR